MGQEKDRPRTVRYRIRPLPSHRVFIQHLLRSMGIGFGILLVSLTLGVLGYHLTEGFSWLDSLLNASMILGGMGPVDQLHTVCGKLFASFYAIFSGVIFISSVAVFLSPVVHRFLHKFRGDVEETGDDEEEAIKK